MYSQPRSIGRTAAHLACALWLALLLGASAEAQLELRFLRSHPIDAGGTRRLARAVARDELRGTVLVGNNQRINNRDVSLLSEFDSGGTHVGDIALPCLPTWTSGWVIEAIVHERATDTYLVLRGDTTRMLLHRVDRQGACAQLASLCWPVSSLIPAPTPGSFWMGMLDGRTVKEFALGSNPCTATTTLSLPNHLAMFRGLAWLPQRGRLLVSTWSELQELDLQGRSHGFLVLPPPFTGQSIDDFLFSPSTGTLLAIHSSQTLVEYAFDLCSGELDFAVEPSCSSFGGILPLYASGCAAPGGRVRLTSYGLLGWASFLLGRSDQSWGGVSLPLSLALYGSPACFLRAAPEAIQPVFSPFGPHVLDLSIPLQPYLVGLDTYVQCVGFPGAPIAPATTNLLRVRVG